MKKMKRHANWLATHVLLFCLVLLGSCARVSAPLTSPSGAFVATTEISGEEAGPTRRFCVRLKVTDTRTKREMTFQTGASNAQKWAVAWSPSGSLILYSSDIGIQAYDMKAGQIVERAADEAEKEVARKAYAKKYGKRPRG